MERYERPRVIVSYSIAQLQAQATACMSYVYG